MSPFCTFCKLHKIPVSTFTWQKQPPKVFCKKVALKNFAKFTAKHLCQSLFFNKATGVMPATLLKKRLWHRCFPVNIEKFLRTPLDDCFWLCGISSEVCQPCGKILLESSIYAKFPKNYQFLLPDTQKKYVDIGETTSS